MKARQLKITTILMLLLTFAASAVFAQQEDAEEKKIVIIKKKVDDEGNVIVEKIIKEGEEAQDLKIIELEDSNGDIIIERDIGDDGGDDVRIFKVKGHSDGMENDMMEIKVDVDEDGHEKHLRIIMDKDGEEPEIIEWRGEEMPEDLKKELQEKNIFIHEAHGDGHDVFKIDSGHTGNGNKACMGIRIGMTREVEHINGEETVTIEGESDQGVVVLDIIDDSGAQEAGLLKDDIITGVNGTTVASIEELLDVLHPFEAGQIVSVAYLRGEQSAQVNVTLKQCAAKTSNKMIWINEDGNEFEFDGDSDRGFEDEEGNVAKKKKRVVIIRKNDGGEETTEEIVFEPVEVGDNTLDLLELDLFPNPTDGILNIRFRADARPTTVRIMDVTGKEVYISELLEFDGTFQKEISLGNAAKGTLLLTIQQGDKVFTEKIILH